MLRADERRAVYALIGAAEGVRSKSCDKLQRTRIRDMQDALTSAMSAYHNEACVGANARLDCLTTAVRALAGALRDRMAT